MNGARPLAPLLKNHAYVWLHSVRAIREQPLLKTIFIGTFSVGWLAGLSVLFYYGFEFVQQLGGVGAWLIPQLFTLFFMGLGVMLVLSGAVTSYSNLYQAHETRRLLSWPVPLNDLLYYKYVQSSLMSSWAFFFVILPFVGAYAFLEQWSWLVTVGTFVYSVPFVFLLAGLGMLVMIPFVRFAPRGRTLGLLGIAALVGIIAWVSGAIDEIRGERTDDLIRLTELVPGMNLARHPLTPNYWISEGILALSIGYWSRAAFFFVLLVSSCGVMIQCITLLGRRYFYEGIQRELVSNTEMALQASILSRVLRNIVPGRKSIKAFALKDSLLFMRDPSQWTQFGVFFGILALYFGNIRNLGYDGLGDVWSNLIAFLNIFSLSAVMSSLSSRFVYPQMSMEGRGLWVVGLAPTTLSRVMLTKFVLAWGGLTVVGVSLSSYSNAMLSISGTAQMIASVTMPSVAFALAGMSTGFGAIFMETSAKTPTQILSGYGGTLNLIMTLVMVIVLVLVPGMVSHMLLDPANEARRPWAIVGVISYLVILSSLASLVPLYFGHKALRSRDF